MLKALTGLVDRDPTHPFQTPAPEDVLAELYPASTRKFFLFKQGLRKTNVNFAELIALLQIHCSDKGPASHIQFQFISSSEAKEYISENIRLGTNTTSEDITRLSSSLEDYFSDRIIVEFFYTSACVFLPPQVSINLEGIIVESGYVHSCGDLVFAEDTQRLGSLEAESAISDVISTLTDDERYLLVPYCHEDFTSRDRGDSEFLKDGLDDVKIHISKSFLGEIPLHEFVLALVENHKAMGAAAPTNYKLSRKRFNEQFPGKKMVTIWLISDSGIEPSNYRNSDKRFIICYRQRLKNDNPYHHYEENKPAWVSHTTLPHSLAGAMINIARPWLPRENAVISDPFCGSGTIYLEAQKFPIITCHTSDRSPLAGAIIRDNISFFKLDADRLKKIIDDLSGAVSQDQRIMPKSSIKKATTSVNRLQNTVDVIDSWTPKCGGDFLNLSEQDVQTGLRSVGENLADRILLYVALRASVRGRVTVDRDAGEWTDVFDRELEALLAQMENHLKSVNIESDDKNQVTIADGSYSAVVIPPRPYEKRLDLFGSGDFSVRSVEDLPKKFCDAIICDPPYGFNTETDRWAAEDFAKVMIPALVEALRDRGGQIIMAAPRVSYSGRAIPLTLRSDYLARSVLEYCASTNRRCWKPAVVLPGLVATFLEPPYYWTAEKTLTRKILHFWIRPHRA